jgi:hypothetical protein
VYHLELRQFPHNLNRFNLEEKERRAIVEPWVRERPVEVGERRWSPHQARLRIIEGPRLAIEELSLGRGWRTAQRQGSDVTERVLAAERRRAAAGGGGEAGARAAAPPADPGATPGSGTPPAQTDASRAFPPGSLPLRDLLGRDGELLLAAWRAVAGRAPGLAPSEALALAEREVSRLRGQQP